MFMQDISRSAIQFSSVETLVSPLTTGLVAGTLVETATGWQPIEAVQAGDCVQTLDGGLARILRMDRRSLYPAHETSLLTLPGGHYDACSDLLLLAGQHLLIDTLDDTETEGAPFALIPALALLHAPAQPHRLQTALEIVTPLFADEEVIYANTGVLLHCPGLLDGANRYPENSFFPRLDLAQARALLARRAKRLAA